MFPVGGESKLTESPEVRGPGLVLLGCIPEAVTGLLTDT